MARTNEIERELESEIRHRKSIGQQAKHKKNGCRSKKCSLPSDRYTKKQLKGLNGEVMIRSMRKPMSWAEFKSMPADLQKEYLVGLRDKYGARAVDVAAMFGIIGTSLSAYLRRNDLRVFAASGGRKSAEAEAKWRAFLNGEAAQQDEVQEQQPATLETEEQPAEAVQQLPKVEDVAQPEAVNVPRQPSMKCQTTFTMHCTGAFNVYDFIMELGKFIDEGQPVDITLTGIINPD